MELPKMLLFSIPAKKSGVSAFIILEKKQLK